MSYLRLQLLPLLAIVLLPGLYASETRAEQALTCQLNWQPEQQSSIDLNTAWCAKSASRQGTLALPSLWLHQQMDGKDLPLTGELHYHLTIRHGELGKQTLALRVPRPYDSYKVYINQDLKLSTGDFSETGERARRPHYLLFPTVGDATHIELRVRNHRFVSGGVRDAPVLGLADELLAKRLRNIVFEAFQSGLLLLMAVIQFFQFAQQRRGHQVGLYFGITAFSIAVFAGLGGEHWLNYGLVHWGIDPELSFRWALMATGAWAMVEYLLRLYPQVTNRKVVVFSRVTVGVFLLACLFLPARPLAFLFWGFEAVLLIIAGYFIWVLLQAARQSLPDAKIFLSFYALLYVGIAHDITSDYLGLYSGNLAPVCMVICLIAQGLVLSRQNAQAHLRSEALVSELQRAEKIKDEFLANTSHELRTPLQSIIGLTEADAAEHKHAQLIGDTARRLALLVDDLMDLTRMQHDEIILEKSYVDIESELQTIRSLFVPILRHRELEIYVHVHPQGIQLEADRQRLRQILFNLVGNAVKFTDRGEITLLVESDAEREDSATISVCDTGKGMSPEELINARQRYVKGGGSHTGVGLGLAITQGLLEAHGSHLNIESKPKQGTTASFRLPCVVNNKPEFAAVKKTAISAANDSEKVSGNTGGTPNEPYILVLDDDGTVLITLAQLLAPLKYPMRLESHADHALTHIRHRLPTVLLLDLMMPATSGFELLRSLREQYNNDELPIIVLSARGQEKDQQLALQLGANDYLVKPCEGEELNHRVGLQLALKDARAQAKQVSERSNDPRSLLVELMVCALDRSQRAGLNRTALAELSGQWRVQLDGSTARARTMDKYLSLSSLPKRPNVQKVLRTAHYVNQQLQTPDEQLHALIGEVQRRLQANKASFQADTESL